jgi:hypothetical protein
MLTMTRRSVFSRDFEVRDGIAPVGEFSLSRVGDHTELRVGLDLYEARRFGWIKSRFVLKRYDREIAHANPASVFRQAYEVHTGRFTVILKTRGFLRSDYGLFDGDSEIGWIARKGFWRSTVQASFSPSVDRPIQIWLLWIVTVLWRRAAAAAAAG